MDKEPGQTDQRAQQKQGQEGVLYRTKVPKAFVEDGTQQPQKRQQSQNTGFNGHLQITIMGITAPSYLISLPHYRVSVEADTKNGVVPDHMDGFPPIFSSSRTAKESDRSKLFHIRFKDVELFLLMLRPHDRGGFRIKFLLSLVQGIIRQYRIDHQTHLAGFLQSRIKKAKEKNENENIGDDISSFPGRKDQKRKGKSNPRATGKSKPQTQQRQNKDHKDHRLPPPGKEKRENLFFFITQKPFYAIDRAQDGEAQEYGDNDNKIRGEIVVRAKAR